MFCRSSRLLCVKMSMRYPFACTEVAPWKGNINMVNIPSPRRMWVLVPLVLVAGLPHIIRQSVHAQSSRQAPATAADKSTEIRKLLQERYATLTELLPLLTRSYREGTVDFSILAMAERDALKATLDNYESPKERVVTLHKLLEFAAQLHAMTDAHFKVGKNTIATVLQARAIMLEVRIELLRGAKSWKLNSVRLYRGPLQR